MESKEGLRSSRAAHLSAGTDSGPLQKQCAPTHCVAPASLSPLALFPMCWGYSHVPKARTCFFIIVCMCIYNVRGHRAACCTCMEVRDNFLELTFLLLTVLAITLNSSSLDQHVCPLSRLINLRFSGLFLAHTLRK